MSGILSRLAAFQGITIDGIEPPPQVTKRTPGPSAVAAGGSSRYVDDRPIEEVEEVITSEPKELIKDLNGGSGQEGGTGGEQVVTKKYKIIGNPPNYYVVEGDDGTYPSEAAAQSDADRLNQDWLDSQQEEDTGQTSGPPQPPPPPPMPGPVSEIEGDPVEQFNAREYAQLNYSWLGDELIDSFLEEFNSNGGDDEEALRVIRTTQAYRDKFPGIFRDDNTTLRIESDTPELDYIKIKEDYTNLLQDYNLNPEYFNDQIETLFRNDVSARTFETRLNVAYTTLFPQFDAVKQYYVNNYPNVFPTTEDLSDEAIFASFISEDVSADIINQRVKVSQIGGAFLEQDFAISQEQAQRLVSAGLSGEGAQRVAARAESQLPRLQRLARRFTGREDIFGLSEFIESEVFGEGVADQVRARLEAEAETAFTREGGAAVTQAGVTGLVEQ